MTTTDTLIDGVFDKRYVIKRKLGSGGMADVYLAEDQELGRRVALKLLDERHASDEQFVERFRREAQSAAGLNHPNIVSIFDRGRAEGTYYIAMEYLDGRTLKELLVRNGPTPIPIAIDYARQILGALAFAHRNGIVHRDIKPHNIVVGGDGRLKVTDFGIARSGTSQMTEVGSIVGTAQYLSPEQARGAPVDPRAARLPLAEPLLRGAAAGPLDLAVAARPWPDHRRRRRRVVPLHENPGPDQLEQTDRRARRDAAGAAARRDEDQGAGPGAARPHGLERHRAEGTGVGREPGRRLEGGQGLDRHAHR